MADWNLVKFGASLKGFGHNGATFEGGLLHVVALTDDLATVHTAWDGIGWSPQQNLNGKLHSNPTIASASDGKTVLVLGVGVDDHLWHNTGTIKPSTNQVTFAGWGIKTPSGQRRSPAPNRTIVGDIIAVSWEPGRLDLFALAADNGEVLHLPYHTKHVTLENDHFILNGWEPLGGKTERAPTAVAWGPNRLDVFVLGTDNCVWHCRWEGGPKWLGWKRIRNETVQGPLAAVSWAPQRIDLFALRSGETFMEIVHFYWDQKGEWHFQTLGHPPNVSFRTDPGGMSAVARIDEGLRMVDVFAIGDTYNAPNQPEMYQRHWAEGSTDWDSWKWLGGQVEESAAMWSGAVVALVAEGGRSWRNSVRYMISP